MAALLEKRHEEFSRRRNEPRLPLNQFNHDCRHLIPFALDNLAQDYPRGFGGTRIMTVVEWQVTDRKSLRLRKAIIGPVGDLGHRAGASVKTSSKGDDAWAP